MNELTAGRDGAPAAVRLTERLLSETRDEIRRADAKAAQWLSALGAGAMGVIALWSSLAVPPWQVGWSSARAGVAGCVFVGVAAIAFTLALIPRIGGTPDVRQVAYFGHVHRIGDPVRVRRYIEQAAEDTMPGLVGQLCRLSRLAVLKYRCIRVGTVFGMAAAALALTASL